MASGCRIKSGMTVGGLFQDFDILISDCAALHLDRSDLTYGILFVSLKELS
jgi:hypothetical protein